MNRPSIAETPPNTQAALLDEIAYRQALAASHVPSHLQDGLVAYLVEHHPPGSFLMACLSNDLLMAVKRGDEQSRAGLVAIVQFLYQHAPIQSWGGPASVAAWLKEGR